MALPPIEDNEASWITGAVFAAFAVWKLWLRVRHESRGDKAEAREHAAEGEVLTVMRNEIERLATMVKDMGAEIETERSARHEAERRAAALQWRVELLEQRLRNLGQTP